MGSVDGQAEGLRPGGEGLRPAHVQEAQATGKTNTTPVAVLPLVPQAFVASASQCSHQVPEDSDPVPEDLDLFVLLEPAQDFSDISQESATANDKAPRLQNENAAEEVPRVQRDHLSRAPAV